MLTSLRIVIRACQQWSANGDSRLGAALAYYALFSIVPLLVIAINITGFVYGEPAKEGVVKTYLSKYIDEESAGALEGLVENAGKTPSSLWGHLLNVGLLVFGALGAFVHLRASLCLIWKLEPPHLNTYLATLIDHGLALIMVILTGILMLGSVAASLAIAFVRAPVERYIPGGALAWNCIEFGISVVFLALLFGAIYVTLSGRRISWGYVGYGAGIAALLFTVGKVLLSYYIAYAGTAAAYGSAGSLVVFLVWVYYSSQTLFLGAELIQARRTRHEWLPPEKGAAKHG